MDNEKPVCFGEFDVEGYCGDCDNCIYYMDCFNEVVKREIRECGKRC